jgi:hypothetical protein
LRGDRRPKRTPSDDGVLNCFRVARSLEWDAGCGDHCEDPPRVFVQQKTIKAICRELRVSWKVVRKVRRSEATESHYERGEQPTPRIGPRREALAEMLASNEAKPVRERLTLIRIFEALRERGYEGSYDGCAATPGSGSAIDR